MARSIWEATLRFAMHAGCHTPIMLRLPSKVARRLGLSGSPIPCIMPLAFRHLLRQSVIVETIATW